MTFIKDFISQYIVVIIYTVLTAIAGFLGSQVKKIYEHNNEDYTKRKVTETCIRAVEPHQR